MDLKEWVKCNFKRQGDFAEAMGFSLPFLNNVITKRIEIGFYSACAIKDVTNGEVDFDDLYNKDRAQIEKLRYAKMMELKELMQIRSKIKKSLSNL